MWNVIVRKVECIEGEQSSGETTAACELWQTLAELIEEFGPHLHCQQIRRGQVSAIAPDALAMDIEDEIARMAALSPQPPTRNDLVASLWVARNRQASAGWQLRVGFTSYRLSPRPSYRS